MIIKVNDNGTIKSCNVPDVSDIPTKVSDLTDDSGHYTKPNGGIPASDLADGVVSVEDVQVNGTSIVADGVANIPPMAYTNYGVARVNADYGIYNIASTSPQHGVLYTVKASDLQIKGSAGVYRPIVPSVQDASTFYGLAKAAGDSTQSASGNTVGVYTDEAKIAIQKMLGIYEAPWELINEETFTNETAANHTISVDGNGNPFELTDVVMQFELPQQESESKISGYIQFYNGSTLKAQSVWFNATQAANATGSGLYAIVRNEQGLIFNAAKPVTSNSSSGNLFMVHRSGFTTANAGIFYDADFKITKVIINGITGTGHYKLYGKRKWQ